MEGHIRKSKFRMNRGRERASEFRGMKQGFPTFWKTHETSRSFGFMRSAVACGQLQHRASALSFLFRLAHAPLSPFHQISMAHVLPFMFLHFSDFFYLFAFVYFVSLDHKAMNMRKKCIHIIYYVS